MSFTWRSFAIISLALLAISWGVSLSIINEHRSSHGCSPLTRAPDALIRDARAHSLLMANLDRLFHSTLHIGQWSLVGEVIGVGSTKIGIIGALFKSPDHRRILLDCRYDKIAIGWYNSDRIWLTARLYAQ